MWASLLYLKPSSNCAFAAVATAELVLAYSSALCSLQNARLSSLTLAISPTISLTAAPFRLLFSNRFGNCSPSGLLPSVTSIPVMIRSSLIAICVLYPKNVDVAVLCPNLASSSSLERICRMRSLSSSSFIRLYNALISALSLASTPPCIFSSNS